MPWYIPYIPFFALFALLVYTNFKTGLLADRYTFSGIITGYIVSFLFPTIHSQHLRVLGLADSIAGSVIGLVIMALLCEVGKRLFGTKRVDFNGATNFKLSSGMPHGPLIMTIGDEEYRFSEFFLRRSDKIDIGSAKLLISSKSPLPDCDTHNISFFRDELHIDSRVIPLASITSITGTICSLTTPREVIGFGVVKLMAFVGAFLGWGPVLLCILASGTLTALIGFLHWFG